MKIQLRYIFIFAITFVVISCSKEDDTSTDSVSYSSDIANIMTNHCITCHSGLSPSGNLSLDSYTSVKSSGQSGNLNTRINDASNPMPPSGLMSEDNRQKIKNWIDNNYPE